MQMRALALATVVALLWPGAAGAIDSSGKYRIYGSGKTACSQWLRSRKLKDSLNEADQQWVAGYVTSYNRWVLKGKRSISPEKDPAALFETVDRFCDQNPMETIAGAVESLMLELIRQQQ